jgi:hypothetical protein
MSFKEIMPHQFFFFVTVVATDSFTSCFQLEDKQPFYYFPDKENAQKQNGRLKGQCTSTKGSTFKVKNLQYADNEVFLSNNKNDLERLTQDYTGIS